MSATIHHSFNPEEAKKYGINQAIILQTLRLWLNYKQKIEKGSYKVNGKYYWFVYASCRALEKQLPYMSKTTINKATKTLVDSGILLTGSFNKIGWDKTLWYTIPTEYETKNHFPDFGEEKQSDLSQNEYYDDPIKDRGVPIADRDDPNADDNTSSFTYTFNNTPPSIISPPDSSGTSATELSYELEYTPRGNPKRVSEIASPPPKVPQKGSAPDYELNKEVQLLEDVFYRANPAYNFKNKSYKTACKDIIKAYGIEQALRLAEGAMAIQSEKFAPRIGNPLQLRDKAIEVIGFASSKKKSSRVTFIK